jgi:hypothetical protein
LSFLAAEKTLSILPVSKRLAIEFGSALKMNGFSVRKDGSFHL